MKKLATLISVVALGGLSAMAQGTIQFKNNSSFPILIATGTNAAALSAATAIGTNPTSESLGAGPGTVTVQLYVALASAPTTFFLAGTTLNSTATAAGAQGTFNGNSPYTIPTTVDGDAFTTGTVIDYYFTATLGNNYAGTSETGTGYVLGGGTGTPPAVFGTTGGSLITGWTMTPLAPIPEPSVMILSGLGAAAMLLYRRKK